MPSQPRKLVRPDLAEFLVERRRAQNLTQAQLARELGIEQMSVSRWERGIVMPSRRRLIQVAAVLGFKVDDVYIEEGPS